MMRPYDAKPQCRTRNQRRKDNPCLPLQTTPTDLSQFNPVKMALDFGFNWVKIIVAWCLYQEKLTTK